ncbi:MAG: response regulator [Nitrososphaeraceae archaeon]
MVKITDQNSEIFSGTIDMSQTHNKINRYVSADDLVNPESCKNPTSADPNPNVASVSSRSEKGATEDTETSKVGDELDSIIKQVLVIDDDIDSAIAIRTCLESYFKKDAQGSEYQVMEVTMYSNPVTALVEFKPYCYDLVLVDINMPTVNGYELVEKIIRLDLNIKVCFMSSGEVNYEAIREIHHPVKSFGCFIKKPATRDYLINRVTQELF